MTATAAAAAEEFQEVYGLDLQIIPPHRPCVRVDLPDLVYTSAEAKRSAVIREIARVHASGRPILVGTASVDESEELGVELYKSGISHNILNAKRDDREARVVAEAGALGAVTLSTNMAGRGTDIRLGGSNTALERQSHSTGRPLRHWNKPTRKPAH